MTDSLANDLFLLMLNLSQLQDRERIIQVFTEALNARLGQARLTHVVQAEADQPGPAMAVATTHGRYGRMLITGGEGLAEETRAMVRNAVRMLALILEKHEQSELLRDEKTRLDYLVASRTSELVQANRRLSQEVRQRAQAQEALRFSEEHLRILFDQAADAVFVAAPDGRFVQVNQKACASTGYGRDELLALKVTDIDDKVTSSAELGAIFGSLSPGSHLILETSHRRKDGSTFPVEVTVALLHTPEGPHLVGIARDISERKRAEKKLAELAAIVATSQESIISMDLEGVITSWNRGAENLYGFPASEVLGRPISLLIPPGHGDHGLEFLTRALAGEKVEQYETQRLNRDGRVLELSMTLSPIWDDAGRQVGVSGIARDISERKRAEQALKASLARQRIAMDLAQLVHWEYDVAANLFTFDDQFYALYGTTALQQGGTRMSAGEYARRFLPAEDAAMVQGEIDQALASDEPDYSRQLEHRIVRADGQERIISVRFSVIKDHAGRTIKTYGANQDITERKLARLALEKRLVALSRPMDDVDALDFNDLFNLEDIQGIQDLFAKATGVSSSITTPEGVLITRPSNFSRLCGEIIRGTDTGRRDCRASDAVLGGHHLDGPMVRPCLACGLWEAGARITVGGKHIANWLIGQVRDEVQEDGAAMRAYARHIGADEDQFMAALAQVPAMPRERFELVAQALYALAHQLSTVAYQNVQQARFITEQKKAQQEKADLESQLFQAQKMEALGTLAGGIAHDFNNILGAILGFAEMAREDALTGQTNPRDLDHIIASVGRARELVQQILAFSRKKAPDLRPCDLNRIVRKTRAILERTVPKMIGIELRLAEDLPPVQADPTQIEQVLLNLASNAADAMPEGGTFSLETRLVILDQEYCRAHLEVRPGPYALLEAGDSGQGIDEETRRHIFEPFFTTKEVGRGTGLGLASTYGIVKNHGGHIHCHSRMGRGTTFSIYLPVTREAMARPEPGVVPVDGKIQRGTETILLVDDEEALRHIAARTLIGHGYQVLTASSGEEALEIYRREGVRLGLVVMDLGMPGMGGHKALKAILELDPRAKIVIASGYAADGQVRASLESGAAGYVAKPFRQAELLATLRQVLDRG